MSGKKKARNNDSTGVDVSVTPCPLCGAGMLPTTSYSLLGNSICLHCLLYLGPERAAVLLKVKNIDPTEISDAVNFLRILLTRNQTIRRKEAILAGGRNWWVKLPEFGEYVCKALREHGCVWDNEVLDEVWDRLIEEAVEE